jgi:hypothetical protein
MTISDDILMAYLDNELAPDERARVDTALGTNPELRDRLQQQEIVRRALTAAFGPVVNERLPDHLLKTAMSAPISWRWRLRQSLSQFSFNASGGQTLPFARFASGAAVLLVGVAIGWIATRGLDNNAEPGLAITDGPLAQALEQQLASDDRQQGPRVGVSFRAKTGQLCRTFDAGASSDNKAGIACRGPAGWTVETLVAAEPRAGSPYETVGSAMPPAVSDGVKNLIAGEPFDAVQERDARDRNWRADR